MKPEPVNISIVKFKIRSMTRKNSSLTAPAGAYPGKYTPAPITPTNLLADLQRPVDGAARPLVNIVEIAEAFVVELAAPGLRSDDFMVHVNGDILSVSVSHNDTDQGTKSYRLHGFNYSCFNKDIAIPENIDPLFISTVYANGILYVRLPKSEQPCMRRVERVPVY
jgi:HSP20 family protein